MRGSRVVERVRRHVDAQNEALNCLADGRLVALLDERSDASTTFEIRLGPTSAESPRLLPLRGGGHLLLDVRQKLFFASTDEFDVTSFVISYTYRLLVASTQLGSEVVSFHWTPDAEPPQRTYPHIHVGSVVTRGSSYRPKDFNRLHIPTGSVSLDAVLLFAVEELGVEPKPGRSRDDVLATLREGERWFRAVASTAEDR